MQTLGRCDWRTARLNLHQSQLNLAKWPKSLVRQQRTHSRVLQRLHDFSKFLIGSTRFWQFRLDCEWRWTTSMDGICARVCFAEQAGFRIGKHCAVDRPYFRCVPTRTARTSSNQFVLAWRLLQRRDIPAELAAERSVLRKTTMLWCLSYTTVRQAPRDTRQALEVCGTVSSSDVVGKTRSKHFGKNGWIPQSREILLEKVAADERRGQSTNRAVQTTTGSSCQLSEASWRLAIRISNQGTTEQNKRAFLLDKYTSDCGERIDKRMERINIQAQKFKE